MHNTSIYTQVATVQDPDPSLNRLIEDYAEILHFFGLEYKAIDYNLQVGEIEPVQGWILHLSVVVSQVVPLMERIIPLLMEANIPFKIVQDKEIARNLLGGNLGLEQIGKIMSIYPTTDSQVLSISKELIELTASFKGPSIPTDIHLGSVVYTRYGSFNPIVREDENGKKCKYIYATSGQLMKDPYSIPFRLPNEVSWPFAELAPPVVSPPKKILHHIYKPLVLLKSDAKGDVLRGLYVKGLFRLKDCLIKQGKQHALAEDSGRDIHDRLLWQMELQQKLAMTIPVPKILDMFQEGGDTYLIMEFIKGVSLYDRRKTGLFSGKSWLDLDKSGQMEMIAYLLQIISILERLHEMGFVHRDVIPGNFMITKKGQVFVIDLELVYSLENGIPDPPFEYGTLGFMSPEQQLTLTPTVKEDIYGLGALMITLFTGLSPVRFNTFDPESLASHISFFIGNKRMGQLIARCLDPHPLPRPSLETIHSEVEQYRIELASSRSQADAPLSYEYIDRS